MNILIDFTQIPVQKSGVGVYAFNLISKISQIDKENNYFILMQNDDNSFDFIKNSNFIKIKVRSKLFRKLPLRFLLEQIYIPYLALKYKIDALHSLHYSFPLFTSKKKIVTICDMTFFKFPESHILIKRYYFRFFIYLASLFADEIIAISNSTINDFRNRFKKWKNNGRVIYLGIDKRFNPDSDESETKELNDLLGINRPYLLFIGTIEPRKNIKNLILAFSKLLNENYPYQLVIAGKKGWYFEDVFNLARSLNLSDRIIFTGFIDEHRKPALIKGAKIFIYPSIYEGFGIPVLEALSCGIPTITSNISSLPEVAGDSALFADPFNPDDLHRCIKRLLDDKILYEQLKKKSLDQSKKFSWDMTARETIATYLSVHKETPDLCFNK